MTRAKDIKRRLELAGTGILFAAFVWFAAQPERTAMLSLAAEDEEQTEAVVREDVTTIVLDEDGCTISGSGATADEGVITINESGAYRISGSLQEGQIRVEAKKSDSIGIALDSVSILNKEEPAIYIASAKDITLYLPDGSESSLVSGEGSGSPSLMSAAKDAGDGTIYAHDNLSISGPGSLEIIGYINNGIHCTDDLLISGGRITIDAVNHGINGKDSLTVSGGTITVSSGKDALHSQGAVIIEDGELDLTARDDGIHADTELKISGGDIDIFQSYEGLEGNQILIEGGQIRILASDDGINAYGGSGFGNPGGKTTDEAPVLRITDGEIYINAQGDGLDSNADLLIEGGMIIVDGPSDTANGAIDSGIENGGSCSISGGTVLAIGASGMAETFDSNSTQCSFAYTTDKICEAKSEIVIMDEEGNVLMEHTAERSFSSVVFSSPNLKQGSTCTLSINGEKFEIALDEISNGDSYFKELEDLFNGDLDEFFNDGMEDPFGGRMDNQPDRDESGPPDEMWEKPEGEEPDLPGQDQFEGETKGGQTPLPPDQV